MAIFNPDALQAPVMAPPAVSAGRSGPVALGFGSGVVATYEPALLHFDHEPDFSFFEVPRVCLLQRRSSLKGLVDVFGGPGGGTANA